MKRAVYSEFGTPETVLQSESVETPRPGPGQVLVKMVLSPIHNHDLWTVAGNYGLRPTLPAIGGTEAVGVVAALGDGVTNLTVGQRVAGSAEQTWAEFYLADARRLVPVPASVDDETACQLVAMPLSTKMLIDVLNVKAGEWIAINAANGAVGKLLAQYGAEKGINVLGLVRRKAAVQDMVAIGNTNIVATESEGWQDKVAAITTGAPIVRGVESLGGHGAEQLLSILADGAELISFGAMTGEPLTVSAGDLIFRNITVKGFWGARPPVKPERIGELLSELVRDAASGALKLEIENTYSIDQVAEAARASGEPGRKGKIAIRGA
jgi:NADPH:quinone reductase-like Zn-dependent oxidoreductase